MAAKGGHIHFMFLGPPYPAAGSATRALKKFSQTTIIKLFADQSELSALPAGCNVSQWCPHLNYIFNELHTDASDVFSIIRKCHNSLLRMGDQYLGR